MKILTVSIVLCLCLCVAPAWAQTPDTILVNGKVLMQNRQVRTMNRGDVIAQAKGLAQKVRDAVQ